MQVTKKDAKLIKKGVELTTQIAKLNKELVQVKEHFKEYDAGTYKTDSGECLRITDTATFSNINPKKAKKAFEKRGVGKKFEECVTITVSCARKYLSDTEIDKLRKATGIRKTISFKGN